MCLAIEGNACASTGWTYPCSLCVRCVCGVEWGSGGGGQSPSQARQASYAAALFQPVYDTFFGANHVVAFSFVQCSEGGKEVYIVAVSIINRSLGDINPSCSKFYSSSPFHTR